MGSNHKNIDELGTQSGAKLALSAKRDVVTAWQVWI